MISAGIPLLSIKVAMFEAIKFNGSRSGIDRIKIHPDLEIKFLCESVSLFGKIHSLFGYPVEVVENLKSYFEVVPK